MRARLRFLLPLLALVVVAIAVWYTTAKREQPPSNQLAGSGTIEATEVDVTAQIPDKLTSLAVHEGDSVRAGQVIATLDTAALETQVQQAEGAVRTAQAQLQELEAGSRPEEIAGARAQYQAARDALAQAQAHFDLVRAGSRPEEVNQLRANAQAAQVALINANTELRRASNLYAQGAIAQQQVDTARTRRDTAAAQLEAARQRLLEAQRGSRPEDIRAARAAVAQARSQAAAAKAALALALRGPRSEDIAAARARLAQTQAALRAAQVQRGYARITAPMNGTVTLRNLEPGDYVTPGTPIVRLADLDHIWMRVYIPENDLGRVKLGQRAEVKSDTYPNKVYRGRVIEIAQEPEFTPKNVQTTEERETLVFGVKVTVENPSHDLKPGLPADATIEVGPR